MLGPSDKTLDFLETFGEIASNLLFEVIAIGFKLDPEVMDILKLLSVKLNDFNLIGLSILFFFLFTFFFFKFKMGKKVKVFLCAGA